MAPAAAAEMVAGGEAVILDVSSSKDHLREHIEPSLPVSLFKKVSAQTHAHMMQTHTLTHTCKHSLTLLSNLAWLFKLSKLEFQI